MAHVEDTTNKYMKSASGARLTGSPFYSRAYGGYTAGQKAFYLANFQPVKKATVLDPMAGQGFSLAELAYEGANVWLGDINPTMCLLACLRDPSMMAQYEMLTKWTDQVLHQLPSLAKQRRVEYVNEWVSPSTKVELEQYRQLFGLEQSPFEHSSGFWDLPLSKRFAAALPILAARELTCFRSSDNSTWIKPGGLERGGGLVEALTRALRNWNAYARSIRESIRGRFAPGHLHAFPMNAALGQFGSVPEMDAVITSPPYANRLDYTRMWGPETEIAAAIWKTDISDIKASQIGSNVVRRKDTGARDIVSLPNQILEVLEDIKNDTGSYASKGYYYPFFRNYASSLAQAVEYSGRQVKRNGVFVIFVRDTVRKDILFPTGQLVEELLTKRNFQVLAKERLIVRRHVGLRRRASLNGMYGIGQQEWWLAFRRIGQ